jgi:hypothetical protein
MTGVVGKGWDRIDSFQLEYLGNGVIGVYVSSFFSAGVGSMR